MANKKIRILIVDDSALVRQLLSELLARDPELEVVGTAQDAYVARDKIKQLNPDVLTLDVEMPRMDGIQFLANLMRLRPMPVVMVSTLTERGAEVTLNAMELGAIDFVTKPKIDLAHSIDQYSDEIIGKVKLAAKARVRPQRNTSPEVLAAASAARAMAKSGSAGIYKTTEQIVAIGSSTGGTEAVREILEKLPPDFPGIVISQHIPAAFSGPFAARMDTHSAMTVHEAQDGQQILRGHVYIAPGNYHLLVVRDGARYICRLSQAEPVNRHRPSVDVMFNSVAENVGRSAIGAILTGMGNDGAKGLKAMLDSGARTIAQDEATSVVWGMPGSAVNLRAAEEVLPLGQIAEQLITWASAMRRAADSARVA
jgi:two-component system, chemotaxis family, protein-glutamate methylesterase/glutaminase